MAELLIPQQAAGIYFGTVGNVPAEWLAAQKQLTVLTKDGYSFYKANEEVFKRRLANPVQETVILINNPDTPFLSAITDKDHHKTKSSQRNDYMQTILLLQAIREAALQRALGREGVKENFVFAGYDTLPTENIFLGDETLIKKFYPTEPYRGSLEGCLVDARKSAEALALFKRAGKTCEALLDGETRTDTGKPLKPARDLMSYRVPDQYRTQDLRR